MCTCKNYLLGIMILEKIFLIFLSVKSILGIGVFYSSQKVSVVDIWLAYLLLFHADKNNLRNSEEYFAYCKNHGMESGLNKYAISNLIRKNRWLWNLFSTLKERARDDEMLNPDQNDFKFFVMLQCFTITNIHFFKKTKFR